MSSVGEQVVLEARNWLGTPYRHQASLCHVGCDCLGLLRGIWRQVCHAPLEPLPPYPRVMARHVPDRRLEQAAGRYLIRIQKFSRSRPMQPGTVLLFTMYGQKAPTHCAIALNDSLMIHAQERRGVVQTALTPQWYRRIHSLYLFPDTQAS